MAAAVVNALYNKTSDTTPNQLIKDTYTSNINVKPNPVQDKKLVQDVQSIKDTFHSFMKVRDKVNSVDSNLKKELLTFALAPFPLGRRIMPVKNNNDDDNNIKAIGLGALGLINVKEDCRDILTILGKTSKVDPELKSRFKFFAGTFLEPLLLKSELGKKIFYDYDTTLAETNFGDNLTKVLGVKHKIKLIKKEINFPFSKTPETIKREYIFLEGHFINKVAVLSLNRMTKISIIFASILELPKIIESMIKDKSGKQIGKSAINVTSYTLCGALLSSLGALTFGAAGSVLGLGIGLYLGNQFSKWINSKY